MDRPAGRRDVGQSAVVGRTVVPLELACDRRQGPRDVSVQDADHERESERSVMRPDRDMSHGRSHAVIALLLGLAADRYALLFALCADLSG